MNGGEEILVDPEQTHEVEDLRKDFCVKILGGGLRRLMVTMNVAAMASRDWKDQNALCGKRLHISHGMMTRVSS